MTNHHKKSGFTLIELLVVIAIIALLLSIIVPALRLAKEKAQNIACRTNVRSLGIALRLYTEQSEGRLFSYLSGLYLNQLADQIGDINKVRYCSTTLIDETVTATTWGSSRRAWTWANGVSEPEHGSYGLNGWLYSYPDPADFGWIESVPNLDKFAYPSTYQAPGSATVPVFFDSLWVDAWPKDTDTVPASLNLDQEADSPRDSGTDSPVNNHMRRLMLRRHWGNANVSFLDGHVENVNLEDMWSLKWHREFIPLGREKLRIDGSKIYRKTR